MMDEFGGCSSGAVLLEFLGFWARCGAVRCASWSFLLCCLVGLKKADALSRCSGKKKAAGSDLKDSGMRVKSGAALGD